MRKDKYFGLSPQIVPWKINNCLENWLSYKADYSECWKKVYVLLYKIFDRKYYKGGLPFIEKWLEIYKIKWQDKLDKNTIVRDMVYCLHRYGISFQDYWIYEFIFKSRIAREDFVSDKMRYHYCDMLNDKSVLPMMGDKYLCYKRFKQYFKRDVLGAYTKDDYNEFESFIQKHSKFIFKPLNADSGKGVELIHVDEIDSRKFFDEKIDRGAFVVEEVIVQGDEVARMHSACINTFRVVTFLQGNDVKIIAVTWRIGSGNAIMDNAGAGGMYAVVNPEKGFVETSARRYNTDEYYIHPDSGVVIPGFQLPEWNKAIETIREIALSCPEATMVSWDLCYSNKGWMMVEANDNGDWSIIQSNKRVGMKPLLYSLMDKHFNE